MVKILKEEYPVALICCILGVSRSSFYEYYKGLTHKLNVDQQKTKAAVKRIFEEHKSRYGARRIQRELAEVADISIGRNQVRRWMKEDGLNAIQPRSFVPKTTNSGHGRQRSPNLFLEYYDNTPPAEPNKIYIGDITYLPLINGGWAYMATWMDLFSRMIVGEAVADNMKAELVIDALDKAFFRRSNPKGVLIHSDGGGQYVDSAFRKLLSDNHCIQSMTRPDNHYDNAFGESLFSRFKAELMQGKAFLNVDDAAQQAFEYIHGYYNTIRRHSSIGYLSPAKYEKLHRQS